MNRSFFSRSRLLGLIAGLALIGAALPATTLAQDAPAGVNIIEPSATDIMGWGVDNPNLSIPAGQTVIWTNTGAQTHTVSADDGSLDSGSIAPGGTFSLTFDTPGTFTYHCTPHPWMKATITVTSL
jgi:plastocyanin